MQCDLLIKDCSYMDKDMNIHEHVDLWIAKGRIAAVTLAAQREKHNREGIIFEPAQMIDGHNKLAMPGLIDGHTHVCQHLLRGRISDEFPMIWTRFLVPFESCLTPEEVRALLVCK